MEIPAANIAEVRGRQGCCTMLDICSPLHKGQCTYPTIQSVRPRISGHRSHGVIVSTSLASLLDSVRARNAATVPLSHSWWSQNGAFPAGRKLQKLAARPPRWQLTQSALS